MIQANKKYVRQNVRHRTEASAHRPSDMDWFTHQQRRPRCPATHSRLPPTPNLPGPAAAPVVSAPSGQWWVAPCATHHRPTAGRSTRRPKGRAAPRARRHSARASLARAAGHGSTGGHDRTGNNPSIFRRDSRMVPAAVNRSRTALRVPLDSGPITELGRLPCLMQRPDLR